MVILQQRQDWKPPQMKDLKLVIPEHYTFMAYNTSFIALGIQDKYLERTTLIKPSSWLIQNIPWYITSLHCKQINKVKNKLDGRPPSLLASMHVSNYNTTCSRMRLVFLELDTHRSHLDFKKLDENNNEVIPRTFCLQLLNKSAYMTMTKAKFIQI